MKNLLKSINCEAIAHCSHAARSEATDLKSYLLRSREGTFRGNLKSNKRGFTLIELLIVVGIIAVLMAIAIVAINPARQFAKANNARRTHDLKQIVSAIQQNTIDSRGPFTCAAGDLPTGNTTCMGDPGQTPTAECTAYYDICDCLVPAYLPQMPVDPQFGSWDSVQGCANYNTHYTIQSASLILGAPHAQLGETINVTLPGEITVKTPSVTEYPIWQSCETIAPNLSSFSGVLGYKFTTPVGGGEITQLCGYFDGLHWVRLYDGVADAIGNYTELASVQIDGDAVNLNWVCASVPGGSIPVAGVSEYYVIGEISSGGYYRTQPGVSLFLPITCNSISIDVGVYDADGAPFNDSYFQYGWTMLGMVDIIFAY